VNCAGFFQSLPERFGRGNEDHVDSLEQVGVREQWGTVKLFVMKVPVSFSCGLQDAI